MVLDDVITSGFHLKNYSNWIYFRVTGVTRKEKVKQRPQALNTVELMRVASSGLNIGPHYAMQVAERLYIQGFISYPRTETTHYPENFDLMSVNPSTIILFVFLFIFRHSFPLKLSVYLFTEELCISRNLIRIGGHMFPHSYRLE